MKILVLLQHFFYFQYFWTQASTNSRHLNLFCAVLSQLSPVCLLKSSTHRVLGYLLPLRLFQRRNCWMILFQRSSTNLVICPAYFHLNVVTLLIVFVIWVFSRIQLLDYFQKVGTNQSIHIKGFTRTFRKAFLSLNAFTKITSNSFINIYRSGDNFVFCNPCH